MFYFRTKIVLTSTSIAGDFWFPCYLNETKTEEFALYTNQPPFLVKHVACESHCRRDSSQVCTMCDSISKQKKGGLEKKLASDIFLGTSANVAAAPFGSAGACFFCALSWLLVCSSLRLLLCLFWCASSECMLWLLCVYVSRCGTVGARANARTVEACTGIPEPLPSLWWQPGLLDGHFRLFFMHTVHLVFLRPADDMARMLAERRCV